MHKYRKHSVLAFGRRMGRVHSRPAEAMHAQRENSATVRAPALCPPVIVGIRYSSDDGVCSQHASNARLGTKSMGQMASVWQDSSQISAHPSPAGGRGHDFAAHRGGHQPVTRTHEQSCIHIVYGVRQFFKSPRHRHHVSTSTDILKSFFFLDPPPGPIMLGPRAH